MKTLILSLAILACNSAMAASVECELTHAYRMDGKAKIDPYPMRAFVDTEEVTTLFAANKERGLFGEYDRVAGDGSPERQHMMTLTYKNVSVETRPSFDHENRAYLELKVDGLDREKANYFKMTCTKQK